MNSSFLAATIANFIEDQNASESGRSVEIVHGQDLHQVTGHLSACQTRWLYPLCFERHSNYPSASAQARPYWGDCLAV